MRLLFQMGQYQALPVPAQLVLAAGRSKLQAAARLSRFQQEMHFRIMAQRLKMAHAFHRICNGFFIYNAAFSEIHRHVKAFPDHCLQHIHLHLSHELRLDLSSFFIPPDMEFRFFFLQCS